MATEVLFEHRWDVNEDALRRTRRLWFGFGLVIAVLGGAVMVGLHGWSVVQTALATLFFFGIGALGVFVYSLDARTRRSARLLVTEDGTLEVSTHFKTGSFWLRGCREVGLRRANRSADLETAGDQYGYDLVVIADEKSEFVLPGFIGARGNFSTLSDDQAAAFHAAVGRFTTAAPG